MKLRLPNLKGPFVISSLIPRLTQKKLDFYTIRNLGLHNICVHNLSCIIGRLTKTQSNLNFRLSTDGNYYTVVYGAMQIMQLCITDKFNVRINCNVGNKPFSCISIEPYHKKNML